MKEFAAAVEVLVVEVDVRKEHEVEEMLGAVIGKFGRLDYAVNAAGVEGDFHRSAESTSQAFDQVNAVNYRGCWLCSKNEIAQMQTQQPLPTHDGRPGNRGAIVNIASQLALLSRADAGVCYYIHIYCDLLTDRLSIIAAYCASKAAVVSMTKSDAIDVCISSPLKGSGLLLTLFSVLA